MSQRALVTGAAGFLGRHFAAALRERGWTVHGIDLRKQAGVTWGDCRPFFTEWTDRATWDYYDLVVHAAAVVGGRAKIDGDPLALAVNLELDAAMFRWAARARPGRVLYLSSSAVYPVFLQETVGQLPMMATLSEDLVDPAGDMFPPDQVYGWSKLVGERLAVSLREAGVPVTVVRPFSGYGGDQALDYPFPSFIDRARRQADPFDIWGPGTQVRDFIHVSDVIGGALAAADAGVDGPLNLCTGIPTSFNELATMVIAAGGFAEGYRPQVRHLDCPVGVDWRVGDPDRMLEVYQPKVGLVDGIAMALAGTG
jgi:nucleoside-diphosphate-sugar epimerase